MSKISKGRREELEAYFSAETNDEETQNWRDDLTEEEAALVGKWDDAYERGFVTIIDKLMEQIKPSEK